MGVVFPFSAAQMARGLFPGAHNDTTEVVVKRDDNGRLRVSCCILAA